MRSLGDALRPVLGVRVDEMACYIESLTTRVPLPEGRFVIFAHYRTGSTLLQSLLNSHPRILCERELFLDFMTLRFKKVLFPYLYAKRSIPRSRTATCGFVLRLDQLAKASTPFHGGSERFLRRLESDRWRIVHLRRENRLRQAMSNVTSILRRQSHDSASRPMNKIRVHVDPGNLIKTLDWMENISKQEDELMRGFDHVTVTYERDLQDAGRHQVTADKVFSYLNLESSPVTTVMRRIASDNVFDSVINAAEIERLIRESRYAVYL